MLIFLFCLYIALSSSGMLMIKMGTSGTAFSSAGGVLNVSLNVKLLIGIVLYVFSFILSMVLMSQMNLSVLYPLGAGLLNLIICLFSVFVLKEAITVPQWIGIALIAAGVVLMNFRGR